MVLRRGFVLGLSSAVLRGQGAQRKMFADAEAYDRYMGRWSRRVASELIDFARLPTRGRVLDVGSGTGALAFEIARLRSQVRVAGIDPSREYIAYAAEKNAYKNRVSFEVGDAQRLHFEDAIFDGAVSLIVFNFIPDPRKALLELCRITKSGAGISAAVWDYGGGMRMLRIFWDAAVSVDRNAEKVDERHMPLCREGELPALWKQCGLDRIEGQAIDIEMTFESFDDYWGPFLLGQGPAGSYVRKLDRSKQDELRRAVQSRLGLSGGTKRFVLPGRVWAVRGEVAARIGRG